jgi:hypothetical protein
MKRAGLSLRRDVNQHPCRPQAPCPKCALFAVFRFRFKLFREQFGRKPGPAEPLFFDPSIAHPVAVELPQATRQIEEAAQALKIEAQPILEFLNVNSAPSNPSTAARSETGQTSGNASAVASKSGKSRRCSPAPATRAAKRRQPELSVVPGRRDADSYKRQAQSGMKSAWERFVQDERIHGRYKITRTEWGMLSKVAMLGEPRNPGDFVFILHTIRQAMSL